MKKTKVVWEKWVDPLNSNIDEVEYPGCFDEYKNEENPIELLSTDSSFEEKMEEYLDEEDEAAAGGRPRRQTNYNPIRIVSTAHGFVPLTEHSYASKHFDFWTMHCNSDITQEIIDAVEKCDGVETLTPLTRYRLRVGFNRMLIKSGAFDLNDIRKGIEKSVIKTSLKESQNYFDFDKK
tara:strand:+ start:447 stop:983 length:537 start_codon:yes stop_codon:yes gene_type:complete